MWRCSRNPECGGLLLENWAESEESGSVAGSGATEPRHTQRVSPAEKRRFTRRGHGSAELTTLPPADGSTKVERLRSRPRASSRRRAPKPGPAHRPRPRSSLVRLGALLLCFAGVGVALLLWTLRGAVPSWVEASFTELATGFRGAATESHPPLPARVRSQAERLCRWSRARFPGLASRASSPRLFFLHTGAGPSYFDCGRGSWESVGVLSPVYLRTCVAGRDPCDAGVGGFASSTVLRGRARGICDAVVLLPSGDAARSSSDDELRRTVVHEYVIHCGLARHLTSEERETLLERIAERVPHSRLRGWFRDPHREAYYRHRHGVGPDLVTPAGYVDVSSSNPFVTDREQAHGYVEEAFAALVDHNLASRLRRRISSRDDFEGRVRVVADLLLAVAEGKDARPALAAAVTSL